jgi:hypothetical protein
MQVGGTMELDGTGSIGGGTALNIAAGIFEIGPSGNLTLQPGSLRFRYGILNVQAGGQLTGVDGSSYCCGNLGELQADGAITLAGNFQTGSLSGSGNIDFWQQHDEHGRR